MQLFSAAFSTRVHLWFCLRCCCFLERGPLRQERGGKRGGGRQRVEGRTEGGGVRGGRGRARKWRGDERGARGDWIGCGPVWREIEPCKKHKFGRFRVECCYATNEFQLNCLMKNLLHEP